MDAIKITLHEMQVKISLTGEIDKQSVDVLKSEISILFDYYKFTEILFELDSPGGEYNAMLNLMEFIEDRGERNCLIHLHATQTCSSAAALILSSGKWGYRSVERDTKLLFHWARATLLQGQVVTSNVASIMSKNLASTDQLILERLTRKLCSGAGSPLKLIDEMDARMVTLLQNWENIATALERDTKPIAVKNFAWVKSLKRSLKRWVSESENRKKVSGVIAYFKSRFEGDTQMDLREAYALCLIDKIGGVLPLNKHTHVELLKPSDVNDEPAHKKVTFLRPNPENP